MKLQEALWRLHGLPFLPATVRITTLSLAERVRARPAGVLVGGVGNLSVTAWVMLVNVALTYTAIIYQYSPMHNQSREKNTITQSHNITQETE